MLRHNRGSRGCGYWMIRKVFVLLYRVLARVEAVGLENLDVNSPCLLVGNHLSVFDPPLMMILFPKIVNGDNVIVTQTAGRLGFPVKSSQQFRILLKIT